MRDEKLDLDAIEARAKAATLHRFMPVAERFWRRVNRDATCWTWRGGVTSNGYGTFTDRGRRVSAHRYAYEQSRGAIPAGLVLDHLCRNRRCVNPDHLEAVSERVNILRGTSPSASNVHRTHCPRGHEYSVENTRTCRRGKRTCRACQRASWHARKAVAR